MQKVTRLLVVVCFASVLVTSAVLAQDPVPVPPSQTEEKVQSVNGKLKSVDSDAKKLTITSAAGDDMEFTYNDQTMIVGAESTVEGLAGKSGADVTVSFNEDQGVKTATRIDVKPTT